MRFRSALLTAACALLLAAPAAQAEVLVGVINVEGVGETVLLQGDDAANILELNVDSGNGVRYLSWESSTPVGITDARCDHFNDVPSLKEGYCVFGNGTTDWPGMAVTGEGADDKITMQAARFQDQGSVVAIAEGGGGKDLLQSMVNYTATPPASYTLDGGEGNDDVRGANGPDQVFGGPGDDDVTGNEGADTIDGGEGDDLLTDHSTASDPDVFVGGGGFDSIATGTWTDNDAAMSFTLDGQANDGPSGEGDNIGADVEKLQAYARTITFVGTDGPNEFWGLSTGSSSIKGLGGDDVLTGYDGRDVIDGGDGNDAITGGFGDDDLTGGSGVDAFTGDGTERDVIATGNDTIHAADGIAESISCDIGADVVEADGVDTVDSSCETVKRSGGTPPPPPLPPCKVDCDRNGGNGQLDTAKTITTLKALATKLKSALRSGVKLEVPCSGASCAVAVTVLYKGATVGSGKGTVAKGGGKVTAKLTAKGRKRLRKLKKASLTFRVRRTDGGKATTTTTKLVLR